MSLPTLNTPTFRLTIPSTGIEKKFRPFLVKEEKALLLAIQDTMNSDSIGILPVDTIKSLIKSCFFDDIDIDSLATFDIEYILLQLRAKSKGNLITLEFECQNEVDGNICGTKNFTQINLEDVKVVFPEGISNNIILDDTNGIGVHLRYPSFEELLIIQKEQIKDKKDITKIYDVILNCIEYIFDNDGVYKDFTKKEISDWFDGVTQEQSESIKAFFENLPTVQIDVTLTCKKCGHTEVKTITGLSSFLD